MHWIDWLVVLLYAGVVLGIGIYTTLRQDDTDEYFRGSRELPWWAIGISIIATSFSAASLLGAPGEGYNHGFLWIQLQLGDLIGYGLVAILFLPVFVRIDITSAYAYLERRFDLKTRWLGALCFFMFVLVRLGGLLYGMSLMFAEIAGIPLHWTIVIVGIISILYTVAGGISAVVWTDFLQFIMILIGVSASVTVIILGVDGGFATLWSQAAEAGKTNMFQLSWDPGSIRSLPTALLGYGILAFSVAGTNQQTVQRYVSCKNVKDSIKATLLGWFSGAVGITVTLLLGIFLFVFYATPENSLGDVTNADKILPYFIHNELPAGIAGIMVSAVFAAAMSSIDSALHSLATSSVVDFLRPIRALTDQSASSSQTSNQRTEDGKNDSLPADPEEVKDLTVSRYLVAFFGVLGIAAALYAANQEENLLEYLVTYTAYFLGPLLGLFLLGLLSGRAQKNGAFWGTLFSIAWLIVLASYWADITYFYRDVPLLGSFLHSFGLSLPSIWYPAIAAPLTFCSGFLFSLFGEKPPPGKTEGLVRFGILRNGNSSNQ